MARNTTKMTSRYYVTGRVQGVGYRHWVVQRARALELIGWVSNRRDGRVEVAASVEKGVLDTRERDLSDGQPAAAVTGVEIAPVTPGEDHLAAEASGLGASSTDKIKRSIKNNIKK